MTPFKNYWNKQRIPQAKIVFDNVIPKAQAIKDLNAGKKIDLVTSLTPAEAKQVKASDHAHVVKDKHAGMALMGVFNQQSSKAMRNAAVRRALNHAVQRQQLLDKAYGGYGTVTAALLRAGAFGANDSLKPYAYQPAKAKKALAKAGVDKLTIVADETLAPVAQGLAKQLKKVGVDASVTTADKPAKGSNWDIWLVSHFDWYPRYAAGVLIREYFGQSGDFRRMKTNPKVTHWLQKIRGNPGKSAQAKYTAKLEKTIHDKALGLFLFAPYTLYGVANNVSFKPYDSTVLELAGTTIKSQ